MCSMFVEIIIEPTYPVLPKSGESQFRIFNGHNCNYNIGIGFNVTNFDLLPGHFHAEYIWFDEASIPFTITGTTSSPGCSGFTQEATLESGKANSFFLSSIAGSTLVEPYEDDPEKSRQGRPLVRVLANLDSFKKIELKKKDNDYEFAFKNLTDVVAGEYKVFIDEVPAKSGFDLKLGGVYTIIIIETSNDFVS